MGKLQLSEGQKKLRRRIIEITHKAKTCHLGSCLGAVDIIDVIFKVKSKDEKFVLSNGHAAVALYAVLEKHGLLKNPDLKKLNVHPDRNPKKGIDVSTGSLGQGLPVAVGLALSDRSKKVYCLISDGECNEGSIWESLRIAYEASLGNLIIIVNANGWRGYGAVDISDLAGKLKGYCQNFKIVDGHNPDELFKTLLYEKSSKPRLIFAKTKVSHLPFLNGQDAHYFVMDENDFLSAMETLR